MRETKSLVAIRCFVLLVIIDNFADFFVLMHLHYHASGTSIFFNQIYKQQMTNCIKN